MLASLPARHRTDPFPNHPIAWMLLSAVLVVAIVARPRSGPPPADSIAVPVSPAGEAILPAKAPGGPADYAWLSRAAAKAYQPLEQRIASPSGYERVAAAPRSFAEWLRRLPVRPPGTPVLGGDRKVVLPADAPELAATIDLQPGSANLLNASNVVLRLRAEYLWAVGPRETIRLSFTNGDPFEWARWSRGERPIVSGRAVSWQSSESADESRRSFAGYLETLFKYSSVHSLMLDTHPVTDETVQAGDVFVIPGRPGHAIVVLDVAARGPGDVCVLLGQGGTPARTFYVVAASPATPWFELRAGSNIDVPGWGMVSLKQLRRW
jgi:hypothetical protein